MIVAFSTSSPLASVAFIDGDVAVASAQRHAPMAASGACMALLGELLEETGKQLGEATLFLSDLGPGSFTGVKVGVTLAKTLAFAHGAMCGGVSSFDLIDADGAVVLPSKRGEWFLRVVGQAPVRTEFLPDQPFTGYGPGIEDAVYPLAERFAGLIERIHPVQPEVLVAEYLIEPSVSQPKTPYRDVRTGS